MNKKDKFYKTIIEEQETLTNVDYFGKSVRCYTSRQATYSRLKEKLGEPTHTYYTQSQISGAYWEVPFSDKKKLSVIFSRPTIIGSL